MGKVRKNKNELMIIALRLIVNRVCVPCRSIGLTVDCVKFAAIRMRFRDACVRRRRVIGPDDGLCAEPGFITIGNDYENCSTAVITASNCPGGGESVSSTAFWIRTHCVTSLCGDIAGP